MFSESRGQLTKIGETRSRDNLFVLQRLLPKIDQITVPQAACRAAYRNVVTSIFLKSVATLKHAPLMRSQRTLSISLVFIRL